LIGRSELADVCIDSTYVSRYHALIVREMGRDLLIDLGSTNAVLVNGKRVLRHFLRPDDLIQIGPARLTYSGRRTLEVESEPGLTVSMMGPRFTTLPDGSTVISIGSGTDE
jgi:pSer/pThr/pTyr-binding forkhead associated (FHA) protein